MPKKKTDEEKIEVPEDKLKEKALAKAAEKESLQTEAIQKEDLEKSSKESLKAEEPVKIKETPKIDVEASSEQVQASSVDDIKRKKKELLEKVKKLKGKVDTTDTEALKKEVKLKKRVDMLIPLEDYVRTGIYLGTRVVTPDMKQFVYRRRADGLAIFNTDLIDQKIKESIEYLSKFNSKDVILVCKRQSGWKFAKKFGELTGIRVFTKKYPAGILTNTQLRDFFETELTIVADGWLDKNALKDTLDTRKKVLMICGTNNFSKGANQVIIGNNKSGKSLGLIFYLLARGYCKNKKIEADIPDLEWWIDDSDAIENVRYPQKKERRNSR